jgi:hypothetical protein
LAKTFRFNVWGDEASTDLGFTLADPAVSRLDLEIAAVARPQVLAFAPEVPNGGAMLVMAGGGYTQLMAGKEGVEVALWLNGLGYHAFVLIHRFPDAAGGPQAPVDDAIEAMRLIRARAPAWASTSTAWAPWACRPADTSPPAWSPPIRTPGPRRRRPRRSQPARPDALIVGYGPISTNAKRDARWSPTSRPCRRSRSRRFTRPCSRTPG